ncbi:DUF1152 domain-containing protein [Nocardia sp. NPDC051750]|uniref:DUF1152 domain-containing protein n=1 Tax=Nocardia sp. NPDC051750 TaxID=3364325 RepID=UPI0037B85D61
MTAIAIAAGGGGDAVTAAVLAHKMPALGVAAIMAYSWDRLMIDPEPGPRARADFRGLIDHGGVSEVLPTSSLRAEGQSTLPRLAEHVAQPLLLMDIRPGTTGLAHQVRCAAAVFDADELVVIDTGGDILAAGDEPGLRSPLADSVALAAAIMSGLPTRVLVAGVGLDGELSRTELDGRLNAFGAADSGTLTAADVDAFAGIWSWHPSEANSLLAVAASGWRGFVETQRGVVVDVTSAATRIYQVAADALAQSSLSALVASTSSLDEIEQLLRERRGYSDIDIERDRLAHRRRPRRPDRDALDVIDRYATDADARSVDALTIRRVIELASATEPAATEALRIQLAESRSDNFKPPLYLVHPLQNLRRPGH